jgi:predicted nucleotidyltransferase
MQIEKSQLERIRQWCKNNKVKSLFAFGSVLRDDFNAQSDIDLIVDFEEKDPFTYTDLYFNLKNLLEELFNRNVDLLEERAIRNPLFKEEIDKTKVLIYG